MRLIRVLAIVMVASALLGGCAMWRPITVPIRTLAEPAQCARPADTLVVMLPGSYSLPEDFRSHGFVKILRDRHVAADLVLVDAHVGYYQNRSIVDRLSADVIQPARARGYKHVWLAGISIGGVGAMLYAAMHPNDVDGVVLIAPYLGTPLTAKAIKTAGGLAKWPLPLITPEDPLDPLLWGWLQGQVGTDPSVRKVSLWLGYGLDDRFVYNDDVLRAALPARGVFTTPGGHDWPPWTALWTQIVAALPLPTDATCR
jgi:pimeloyl-ACP methyl ester carboxylesterase